MVHLLKKLELENSNLKNSSRRSTLPIHGQGHVRAASGAQGAARAAFLELFDWTMTFGIDALGYPQHLGGASRDAKAAAFAKLLSDRHSSFRHYKNSFPAFIPHPYNAKTTIYGYAALPLRTTFRSLPTGVS
jgi:hypothetical protein